MVFDACLPVETVIEIMVDKKTTKPNTLPNLLGEMAEIIDEDDNLVL